MPGENAAFDRTDLPGSDRTTTENLLVTAARASSPGEFVSETTRSGGGTSLFSMESLRREAPNPKLQRSSKVQTSTRRPGWPPHRSDLGLELEFWNFFGAWYLVVGASLPAVFR
jgi:hypothetical protein